MRKCLTDSEVLALKRRVRERDNHRCVRCGAEAVGPKLDVHRLIPTCEYTMEHCITVCKECHRQEHRRIARMALEDLPAFYNVTPPQMFRMYVMLSRQDYDKVAEAASRVGVSAGEFCVNAAIDAAEMNGIWNHVEDYLNAKT